MKRVLTAMLAGAVFLTCCAPARAAGFSKEDISAESAVLINADSGEIVFEKNACERRPMASTTKIMSVLLCIESGGLDEQFVVDSEAIKTEGSSMGLMEGDTVTKRALCYGMLLPSGNDAANAAAVRVAGSVDGFVAMMNDRAERLGLRDTHFVTPSGLDDYTDEHYSTAYDMAMLARECMRNETFAEMCGESSASVEFGNPPYMRRLYNTNKLLGTCRGANGIKTGFTDKAGRCLISSCERDGVRLICVTLDDPNDWRDHNRMFDHGFSLLSNGELECDYYSFSVDIVGGMSPNILCSVKEKPRATLAVGDFDRVTSEVVLPKFVYAPVAEGERVGEIRFYCDGRQIAKADITANESVMAE